MCNVNVLVGWFFWCFVLPTLNRRERATSLCCIVSCFCSIDQIGRWEMLIALGWLCVHRNTSSIIWWKWNNLCCSCSSDLQLFIVHTEWGLALWKGHIIFYVPVTEHCYGRCVHVVMMVDTTLILFTNHRYFIFWTSFDRCW